MSDQTRGLPHISDPDPLQERITNAALDLAGPGYVKTFRARRDDEPVKWPRFIGCPKDDPNMIMAFGPIPYGGETLEEAEADVKRICSKWDWTYERPEYLFGPIDTNGRHTERVAARCDICDALKWTTEPDCPDCGTPLRVGEPSDSLLNVSRESTPGPAAPHPAVPHFPDEHVGPPPGKSIMQAFVEFHSRHPEVYMELVRMARTWRAKNGPQAKVGIATLYEALRWRQGMGELADQQGFKLNNNYRAEYARMIMVREPALDGIFTLRDRSIDG